MKSILRIGAMIVVVAFAFLGGLHVASSLLARRFPSGPFERVIGHRADLRANEVTPLIELAALARRFKTDQALVAQLKPLENDARDDKRILFIPKSLVPVSYTRAQFFTEEPSPFGSHARLICDRDGKPLSMHLLSGREGLFIAIDPEAMPRGDNLMLKVYEYPAMYVFAHAP